MAGDMAKLPCDVTLPNPKDRVKLVLWFRNFSDSPFYTYVYVILNSEKFHSKHVSVHEQVEHNYK